MIRQRIYDQRTRRGALVAEALVSVALLTLVAVAVSRFAGTVSQMRRLQANRSEALELAANTLEELMIADARELASISKQISSNESRSSAKKFRINISIRPRSIEGQQGNGINVDIVNPNLPDHSLAHLEGWTPSNQGPEKEVADD